MPDVRITDEIVIAAPVELVYAHRLDFTQLPLINPNVLDLERTDDLGAPGPGSSYRFVTRIEGMGDLPTTLLVTSADEPRSVSNVMESAVTARETVTIDPVDEGARVTFDLTVELPDGAEELIPMVRESSEQQVRLELENMKTLLEGSA